MYLTWNTYNRDVLPALDSWFNAPRIVSLLRDIYQSTGHLALITTFFIGYRLQF